MTIQPPLSAAERPDWPDSGPDGRPLLTVSDYDDAVRAVDALADARFPVDHVAIVGHGVRTVEAVTGRYGRTRAVATVALAGGLVGLFFGLLFDWWGAVTPQVAWGWLAVEGLAYGLFAGLIVALLLQRSGTPRDFSSVRTLDADHYDVTLTGGERAEAMRILHTAGIA
jgi:hypothetical protein